MLIPIAQDAGFTTQDKVLLAVAAMGILLGFQEIGKTIAGERARPALRGLRIGGLFYGIALSVWVYVRPGGGVPYNVTFGGLVLVGSVAVLGGLWRSWRRGA